MTEQSLRFKVYSLRFKAALGLVLAGFLFINSCKPDFSVIAPYKPIAVVYGLLDPAASIQYIKINKAYLGQGNALIMAQQRDSINYAPGVLNVQLQEVNSGKVVQTIQLDTTTTIPKDPGLFSNPYQLLYFTTHHIDNDATYNLVIYNKADQQTITSSTPTVGILDTLNMTPGPGESIDFTGATNPTFEVNFTSDSNAVLYNLFIRFYYTEINTTTGDTTNTFVDWNLGTQLAQHLNDAEQITFDFTASGFYSYLKGQLTASPNLKRTIDARPLDFLIYFAGDNLNTYIQVNQPSIGIVQDVPAFSNIAGGVGIFSTRSSVNLYRRFDPASLDSLQEGQYTRALNFQ